MLDWGLMAHYFPFLLQGAVLTLKISVFALILGFIFGISAALLKLSKNPLLRGAAGFYIWIVRSTPLLVQLFLIYFGLPQLGIDLGSVPHGQMEASRSLGMSSRLAMRRIVLPQAMRIALPSLGNNFVILIKDTSLVSTITLVELTLTAQRLIGSTYKPFEMYLMAAFLYAVLTTATSLLLGRVEKRMAY